MLGANSKPLEQRIFGRPAAWLVKHHVRANTVTVVGVLAQCAVALTLFPFGYLWQGAVVLSVVVTTDALDGTMARLAGTASKWGAFLDSTLDRLADAAIIAGLTIYLAREGYTGGVIAGVAALAAGAIVPYTRARAEALGYQASVGIAERTDRLIVVLVAAFVTGLGLSPVVLTVALAVLAAASFVTVGQRAATVYRQARAESAGQSEPAACDPAAAELATPPGAGADLASGPPAGGDHPAPPAAVEEVDSSVEGP
ncbi:MAG: CDP-alcohol phosphatidyltransferase family protein [Bifidobacteriaceae bacterium]|jgi:CDP-diacylglycerol--glycerol-3-phosphate 3-phosphatidyltransferase|nr:CDP-alcohol phosphatidyltransferase family protein [Bifidobacteriaceae bacterium]